MRPTLHLVPTRRELILVILFCITLFFVAPPSVSDTTSLASYFSPEAAINNVLRFDEAAKPIVIVNGKEGENREGDENTTDEVELHPYPEPRFTWQESNLVPETKILHHAPGFTIFDRLYIFNGTIFIVTSTPSIVPQFKFVTSSGYKLENGEEEIRKRLPTDKDIRVITPEEAQHIFNTYSIPRLAGVSFLNTDDKQYIAHYYHFTAEVLYGLWRTYTALDPLITPDGKTALSSPRRFIFRHVASTGWRDYAALNEWVLHGAFPNMGMEFAEDWADRAKMNVPFVLDRVVLGDRAAATESDAHRANWRFTASAFDLPGSANWWSPLRKAVLEFSGLAAEYINGPSQEVRAENEKYVVTYVSRQSWGRRTLRQEDHEILVSELYALRDRYGYEVNVVSMEQLSRAEQIQLAGRTTIMMGVHGNGLTSLIWMRPSKRSTVIEFFYPGGFSFDYEFTTRGLGMKHYGVWDDRAFTRPDVPRTPEYPEGFHGEAIPLNGAVVARLVHERLSLGDAEP